MSEQKLNSLDRFRKRSPRLLLEEHAGCEVPAGCGGLVMRWRNPLKTRPLRIHLYTPTEIKAWMDGEEMSAGRLDLPPGRHVLALKVGKVDRSAGLLMAVLRHDPAERALKGASASLVELPLCVLSAGDGSWRFRLKQPAKGWQGLDFDDSGWDALVDRPIPEVDWSERNGYQWHMCHQDKAGGLGVPGLLEGAPPRGPVWVRKVFEIPPPPTS
jgi:hypothetical protein